MDRSSGCGGRCLLQASAAARRRQCGLDVPPSLVTNVGAQAREFAAEVGSALVYKSLSAGVVAEQDEVRIIYTEETGLPIAGAIADELVGAA